MIFLEFGVGLEFGLVRYGFCNIYIYKRMSRVENGVEEEVWYIYVGEETRGPMGLRDLDVLLRTN